MPPIRFSSPLSRIGSWTLVRLPKDASKKFPSRGMAMATVVIDGSSFDVPLEPDGRGSHWFRVMKKMSNAKVGDSVTLTIKPMEEWPDPVAPADWKSALAKNPEQQKLWKDITPAARWDWIRWIRMSANPETRKKHIVVALSKMKSGMRRPCCFNRSMCTEPEVSKGGVLLEPTDQK